MTSSLSPTDRVRAVLELARAVDANQRDSVEAVVAAAALNDLLSGSGVAAHDLAGELFTTAMAQISILGAELAAARQLDADHFWQQRIAAIP